MNIQKIDPVVSRVLITENDVQWFCCVWLTDEGGLVAMGTRVGGGIVTPKYRGDVGEESRLMQAVEGAVMRS